MTVSVRGVSTQSSHEIFKAGVVTVGRTLSVSCVTLETSHTDKGRSLGIGSDIV